MFAARPVHLSREKRFWFAKHPSNIRCLNSREQRLNNHAKSVAVFPPLPVLPCLPCPIGLGPMGVDISEIYFTGCRIIHTSVRIVWNE